MRYLPLIVLFAACGGPTGERTECGLVIGGDWNNHDSSKPWEATITLEELQTIETATIASAAKLSKDWRLSDSERFCGQMKDYVVYTAALSDEIAQKYWGLTRCPVRDIMVVKPWDSLPVEPSTWYRSAIAHELLHVGQNCIYAVPNQDPPAEHGHWNWDRDGEFAIVDDVRGLLWKP